MSKSKLKNPFPVVGYQGSDYFCDREKETATLTENIENGISTTLISVRRMGKTGLIQHVFSRLPTGINGVYVDIQATENLNQFLSELTTAILNAIPQKSGLGEKLWAFVKSMRPVISFDPLYGVPQASFDLKPNETETNIHSIFRFLDEQDFNTVIAIDEFQQILSYPEKNTDAWLRSVIQKLKKVVFVFSGSQQHLMTSLFLSPARPFFRSTRMLKLEKIEKEVYANFIITKFKQYGKTIDSQTVSEILDWTNVHTFYVQLLCNTVFGTSEEKVANNSWKDQAGQLLKEQETMFYAYRNMLTKPQWQLLRAIAHEGLVFQPTSISFLNQFHLGSSATVLRSLKTLIESDLIYSEFDPEGKKYYSVNDVLFQKWSQMQ